jgi:hypothetical protein
LEHLQNSCLRKKPREWGINKKNPAKNAELIVATGLLSCIKKTNDAIRNY